MIFHEQSLAIPNKELVNVLSICDQGLMKMELQVYEDMLGNKKCLHILTCRTTFKINNVSLCFLLFFGRLKKIERGRLKKIERGGPPHISSPRSFLKNQGRQ